MKFDIISNFLVYLQGDENEDDNINSQNNDHDSSNQKNTMNTQCKGKTPCKYLFNLTLVNSYGSTDIQVLQDNGKPLKQITGTIIMRGCNPALCDSRAHV